MKRGIADFHDGHDSADYFIVEISSAAIIIIRVICVPSLLKATTKNAKDTKKQHTKYL
jgi:hypothetical protein